MFDRIKQISLKAIRLKVWPSKQHHPNHPSTNHGYAVCFIECMGKIIENPDQNIYDPVDCTAQVMSCRKLWSMWHCGRGSHSVGWLQPINQPCYDHNGRQLHCGRHKSACNSCAPFPLKFQSTVWHCSFYNITFLHNVHDRHSTVAS